MEKTRSIVEEYQYKGVVNRMTKICTTGLTIVIVHSNGSGTLVGIRDLESNVCLPPRKQYMSAKRRIILGHEIRLQDARVENCFRQLSGKTEEKKESNGKRRSSLEPAMWCNMPWCKILLLKKVRNGTDCWYWPKLSILQFAQIRGKKTPNDTG